MRWILAAMLALPALAEQSNDARNDAKVGKCIFVTSEDEQFGGPKSMSSQNSGNCRSWSRWTRSGHFRVDAGCTMKVYSRRNCRGSSKRFLVAGSAKSRSRVISNLEDYGLKDWVRSSRCTCRGAASLERAATMNSSLLADEEDEEDKESPAMALAQVDGGEEEEAEDEVADGAEAEDEVEARAEGQLWPGSLYAIWLEGQKDHRRRRHVRQHASHACSWLFFDYRDWIHHHPAWVQWAGKNQCVESRYSEDKLYHPGKRQTSGYALADPNCRVVFYSKPGCKGDSIRFNPKGFKYKTSGSARILNNFRRLGAWNNRIRSTECQCTA